MGVLVRPTFFHPVKGSTRLGTYAAAGAGTIATAARIFACSPIQLLRRPVPPMKLFPTMTIARPARACVASGADIRTPYIDNDDKIGYCCPAKPSAKAFEDWLKKGGEIVATKGRKCLCNALCANVGDKNCWRLRASIQTSSRFIARREYIHGGSTCGHFKIVLF
jgi:hypothetical protein